MNPMIPLVASNYILAVVFAFLASTLAGILNKEHWPDALKDVIVLIFAVLCALLEIVITGQFTGDISILLGLIPAALTTILPFISPPLQRWTAYLTAGVNLLPKSKPPKAPDVLPPAPTSFSSASQPTAPQAPVKIERDATTMPPALHPDWYKEPNPKEGTTRFQTAQLSTSLLPPIDLAHEAISSKETRPVSSVDLMRLQLPGREPGGSTFLV